MQFSALLIVRQKRNPLRAERGVEVKTVPHSRTAMAKPEEINCGEILYVELAYRRKFYVTKRKRGGLRETSPLWLGFESHPRTSTLK
jgi:hypothetical protein